MPSLKARILRWGWFLLVFVLVGMGGLKSGASDQKKTNTPPPKTTQAAKPAAQTNTSRPAGGGSTLGGSPSHGGLGSGPSANHPVGPSANHPSGPSPLNPGGPHPNTVNSHVGSVSRRTVPKTSEGSVAARLRHPWAMEEGRSTPICTAGRLQEESRKLACAMAARSRGGQTAGHAMSTSKAEAWRFNTG